MQLLLYPEAIYSNEPSYYQGTFIKKNNEVITHSCGIMKMAVLDKNNTNLDYTIGSRIIEFFEEDLIGIG
jgi:5-methylcytosine-specific restriction enzyme subunit McrC